MLRSVLFAAFLAFLGLALTGLAFTGPALAAQQVELRADAAAHGGRVTLADLFDDAGAAGPVTISTGLQPGSQVVLDAARVQAIAAAHGLSWSNEEGLRVIIARAEADGAGYAASAARSRPGETLAYGRDLQTGEIVQPEDLVWSRSAGVPLDAPRDARSVIGQQARRPLRAGAAVSQADVSAAQVIKKDDVVQVVYEAEGLRLVLQAKAINGAAVGQSVSIINPASKKIIEAVASGPGQALVGPRAEQLKAAARADPSLYASIR